MTLGGVFAAVVIVGAAAAVAVKGLGQAVVYEDERLPAPSNLE